MFIELYVYEEFFDYMYYYILLIVLCIDDYLLEKVFLYYFCEWMNKELIVGNYYVKLVQLFSDIQEQYEFFEGIINQYCLNLVLGIFFLVNFCLGVVGIFWMQICLCCEEVGIMFFFGGIFLYIICLLLYEGWILIILGMLIGCLFYL